MTNWTRSLISLALMVGCTASAAMADPVATAVPPPPAAVEPVDAGEGGSAPTPVNEAEALQPQPEESTAVRLGKQLFFSLNESGNVREIAGLLRDSINSLGGICPNVTHYQIYRQTISVTTLKVACNNRPLYLLSVDTDGGMLADGGDGQVEAMDPSDGTISAAPATGSGGTSSLGAAPGSAPTNGAITSAPVAGNNANEAPQGWTRWLFALMALLVALIAYIIYQRLTRAVSAAGAMQRLDRRYSSEDKDRLIEESRQLGASMWRHPSGLYIVRGRQGKRRLFPSWMPAQIYRLWGIKIRQIR